MPAQFEVQTEVTDLPESKVKIAATVPASELDKRLQAAARTFAGEMKLPGLSQGQGSAAARPPEDRTRGGHGGGAPRGAARVVRAGDDPFRSRRRSAIPSSTCRIRPSEGDPLEFTIEVGVRPTAKLGDYKGLEVGKLDPEVPAEAIDAEIERMRESFAGLETVERASGDGDFILIDYAGEIDGEPFEGGAATDFLLELGSDTLIEGFNEGLTGAAAGETRTVEVTFPDEYHAEHLSGKPASFEIEVKEVREKSLPDLDDDFAADNSDFDTLEELRADIEARLLHSAEHQVDHQFRDAALEAAVDGAEIEIPEEIAQARAIEIWERIERSLQSRGMDPAMYLQIQGKDRDEAIADARGDAEAGLKREAVLAAVAEAEGLEATEEDLLEALAPPAGEKGKPEKLLKRLRAEGRDALLVEEITMRKAADLIVDEAKPVETDPEEAREKLWTPEGEGQAAAGDLWTPGDD